jgi:ankyrin repeat protein
MLLPRRQRQLNIAGCQLWLRLLLFLLPLVAWSSGDAAATDQEFDNFLHACTNGEMDVLEIALTEDPHYVHGKSAMGESCLHVAGIKGQTEVTKRMIQAGADPNVRSDYEKGLRMHPLSWNVYGGHVETARALLEGGANVNLDIDHMTEKVTVLDLVLDMLQGYAGEDEEKYKDNPTVGKQFLMRDLLLEFGAKQFKDLDTNQASSAKEDL